MSRCSADDHTLPVITGVGVVCAVGADAHTFWQGIRAGRSGIGTVKSFDTKSFSTKIGFEVDNALLDNRSTESSFPRATRLALIAARQALEQGRRLPSEVNALWVGTTMGDLPTFEEEIRECNTGKHQLALTRHNDFGAGVATRLKVSGSSFTVLTACSAGNIAIARAAELVRSGAVECVLAGGAEAFSRFSFAGFSRLRALSETRCRPFAANRDGMLLGEGAAFLLIEAVHAAKRRKQIPLAAIPGFGLTCDAFHMVAPTGVGAARAMRQAIENAGLSPANIEFVCAHGTGTRQNDFAEAQACADVLGNTASVASIKALTGHALGASSAIEAVACTLSIVHQEIIPQWEVSEKDEACDIRLAMPGDKPGAVGINAILNNAFAFGGNNSCVILQRTLQ